MLNAAHNNDLGGSRLAALYEKWACHISFHQGVRHWTSDTE